MIKEKLTCILASVFYLTAVPSFDIYIAKCNFTQKDHSVLYHITSEKPSERN